MFSAQPFPLSSPPPPEFYLNHVHPQLKKAKAAEGNGIGNGHLNG